MKELSLSKKEIKAIASVAHSLISQGEIGANGDSFKFHQVFFKLPLKEKRRVLKNFEITGEPLAHTLMKTYDKKVIKKIMQCIDKELLEKKGKTNKCLIDYLLLDDSVKEVEHLLTLDNLTGNLGKEGIHLITPPTPITSFLETNRGKVGENWSVIERVIRKNMTKLKREHVMIIKNCINLRSFSNNYSEKLRKICEKREKFLNLKDEEEISI